MNTNNEPTFVILIWVRITTEYTKITKYMNVKIVFAQADTRTHTHAHTHTHTHTHKAMAIFGAVSVHNSIVMN